MEEDIEEVKWISINDLDLSEMDTYPAIKRLLKAYLKKREAAANLL